MHSSQLGFNLLKQYPIDAPPTSSASAPMFELSAARRQPDHRRRPCNVTDRVLEVEI
jgi:hypothetical protein